MIVVANGDNVSTPAMMMIRLFLSVKMLLSLISLDVHVMKNQMKKKSCGEFYLKGRKRMKKMIIKLRLVLWREEVIQVVV